MRILNLHHPKIAVAQLETMPGETWCLYGNNRSGLDQLVDILAGKLDDCSAKLLVLPDRFGVLSFRLEQERFEEELRNDDSDFLDHPDPGTLVRELITAPEEERHRDLLQSFAMDQCLDLGFRQLSSGQTRKLLLLRELSGGATGLLLQNPYDGLDQASCQELNRVLQRVAEAGIEVVLTVGDRRDIPDWCSHLGICRQGRLIAAGPREAVLGEVEGETSAPADSGRLNLVWKQAEMPGEEGEELVSLTDGWASYGERTIFRGLNLTIHSGDHTLISGPNGCGKSTLLAMITGDNHNCYRNNLRIFGRQRGSGESIWEVKRQLGIVSPALHRDYRVGGSALSVILSGLYDTIGLYRQVPAAEVRNATAWLDWLGLADQAKTPFRRLSFAEQRLLLIARALIKGPKLLILDEPTQGLDGGNRETFLDLLEKAAREKLATIVFVSHRYDEHRPFFRQHLHLAAENS
jgi:molybdate transport system ATP-binding protein